MSLTAFDAQLLAAAADVYIGGNAHGLIQEQQQQLKHNAQLSLFIGQAVCSPLCMLLRCVPEDGTEDVHSCKLMAKNGWAHGSASPLSCCRANADRAAETEQMQTGQLQGKAA
eukprot:1154121-Pelagomonas_calceolata.AAC.3